MTPQSITSPPRPAPSQAPVQAGPVRTGPVHTDRTFVSSLAGLGL